MKWNIIKQIKAAFGVNNFLLAKRLGKSAHSSNRNVCDKDDNREKAKNKLLLFALWTLLWVLSYISMHRNKAKLNLIIAFINVRVPWYVPGAECFNGILGQLKKRRRH